MLNLICAKFHNFKCLYWKYCGKQTFYINHGPNLNQKFINRSYIIYENYSIKTEDIKESQFSGTSKAITLFKINRIVMLLSKLRSYQY